MTVVITARDLSTVHERLKSAVEQTLADVGVPVVLRERELLEMGEFGIAKTNSRRVVGSMVDMAYSAEAELAATGRLFELRAVNLRLAAIPCAPLKYEYPGERAAELLSGWQEVAGGALR
jgi:hypothetical protein